MPKNSHHTNLSQFSHVVQARLHDALGPCGPLGHDEQPPSPGRGQYLVLLQRLSYLFADLQFPGRQVGRRQLRIAYGRQREAFPPNLREYPRQDQLLEVDGGCNIVPIKHRFIEIGGVKQERYTLNRTTGRIVICNRICNSLSPSSLSLTPSPFSLHIPHGVLSFTILSIPTSGTMDSLLLRSTCLFLSFQIPPVYEILCTMP
ncbi:hypothetical protein BKA57DRAFT_18739 [Linnemannia elongata]|nr:hypothetical protein BKA57DRAFT_18739 [Linnemannia elongata]